MDPYLEQRWGDFHARFVTYIRDALQPGLPGELRARMEERVCGGMLDRTGMRHVPDMDGHVREWNCGTSTESGAAAAVAEPIVVQVPAEVTERFIQILDVRSGGRVVTVIEVLSPANKLPGGGRNEYVPKQHQ